MDLAVHWTQQKRISKLERSVENKYIESQAEKRIRKMQRVKEMYGTQ